MMMKDIKNRDVAYYARKHGFDVAALRGMGQGLVDCWNYKLLCKEQGRGAARRGGARGEEGVVAEPLSDHAGGVLAQRREEMLVSTDCGEGSSSSSGTEEEVRAGRLLLLHRTMAETYRGCIGYLK